MAPLEWFRSLWPRRRTSFKKGTSLAVSGTTGALRRSPTVRMRAQYGPASRRSQLSFESWAERTARGIRADLRETHVRSPLGRFAAFLPPAAARGAFLVVPPRTRAWRLTARADWREPSRGVLGDSFRWVSAEIDKTGFVSSWQFAARRFTLISASRSVRSLTIRPHGPPRPPWRKARA